MSELRFDGQGAGLGKILGGNHNSLTDYTIVCTCKMELGPVMRYIPNAEGQRSALCLRCKHITLIDKHGAVIGYVAAPKDILARIAR